MLTIPFWSQDKGLGSRIRCAWEVWPLKTRPWLLRLGAHPIITPALHKQVSIKFYTISRRGFLANLFSCF